MKASLFKRQLLLTAVIMTTFIFLGLLAAFVVSRFERERLWVSPFISFARLVDTIAEREAKTAQDALSEVVAQSGVDAEHFTFSVMDRAALNGLKIIADEKLPRRPYQAVMLEKKVFDPPRGEVILLKSKSDLFLVIQIQRPPAHGGPFNDGGPRPSFGRPPGPPLLPGFAGGPHGPPPGPGGPGAPPWMGGMGGFGGPFSSFFLINFGALLVSVLLGSAVSVFLLFSKLRGNAQLAEKVLSEIHAGNLKARFPIKKLDEAGQIMLKFNKMADEVERLVERLEMTEAARTKLLQELAHDLRTPIASLRNLIETMNLRAETLKREDREQLIAFSLREVNYFEHLVEDLLFLAQVKDPKYHPEQKTNDLVALLEEEVETAFEKYRVKGLKETAPNYPPGKVTLVGDPLLLRRLFRNAFENAFSFATTEVRVDVGRADGKISILIRDDGPGLSDDAKAGFGEKRSTRVFDSSGGGRLSVGLGSVIMKAVVTAHQGSMVIRDRSDAAETKSGVNSLGTELLFIFSAG